MDIANYIESESIDIVITTTPKKLYFPTTSKSTSTPTNTGTTQTDPLVLD